MLRSLRVIQVYRPVTTIEAIGYAVVSVMSVKIFKFQMLCLSELVHRKKIRKKRQKTHFHKLEAYTQINVNGMLFLNIFRNIFLSY
jgi:hypothetical protein